MTLEKNNLQLALEDLSSCPPVPETGLPSGDVVVEEVRLPEATEEVADDQMEDRPACEEVADDQEFVAPTGVATVVADVTQPQMAERGMEVADGHNKYKLDLVPFDQEGSIGIPIAFSKKIEEGDIRPLGSSGDEDAVIGGVIVAGGASQKAKNKRRKNKRKSKGLEPAVPAATAAGSFELIKERVSKLFESFSSDTFSRLKGKIYNLDVENMGLDRLEAFCLRANAILDTLETDDDIG